MQNLHTIPIMQSVLLRLCAIPRLSNECEQSDSCSEIPQTPCDECHPAFVTNVTTSSAGRCYTFFRMNIRLSE